MKANLLGLVVAALGGLAVGLERQWSGHATGPRARFGGVRTFTLIGGVGGAAGWLWMQGFAAPAVVLLAGAAALIAIGYAVASRVDVDATTEIGGVIVLATGFLAGIGQVALSSGIVAVTALILLEKSRIHAFVAKLEDEELRAAARFAVMAVVVLPLLPEGPIGPGVGIRPRALWLLVLFFSGLSFAGYIARRAVGDRFGYPVAGFVGGLVSSTNVTFVFSRLSRADAASQIGLALGVIGASTVLPIRVAITSLVLNPEVGRALWPYLVPPFVVGAVALAAGARYLRSDAPAATAARNPLALGAALQMAATFQVVLFLVDFVRQRAGDAGVIPTGVVLGLTDLDALTVSMAHAAHEALAAPIAAAAIGAGLIANSVLKGSIALVLGQRRFGLIAAACLGAMALAIASGFFWR